MKPRILDLFSGAGGATKGLQMSGFHVTGVDIKPQPHYCGDEFHQADALTYPLEGFDAIWASPPCQAYSPITKAELRGNHPKLIGPIRVRLQAMGKPYIIENVKGARKELRNPIWLCGTMFGLPIHRHRYFELSFPWDGLMHPCGTDRQIFYITGCRAVNGKPVKEPSAKERREYLGTPWMTISEMDEAIPPAYSRFIGEQLIKSLKGGA